MNGCQVRFCNYASGIFFWARRMELPNFFFSVSSCCFFQTPPCYFPAKMWLFITGWYKAYRPCFKRRTLWHSINPTGLLAYAWVSSHAWFLNNLIIWFLFFADALVICCTTNKWAAFLAHSLCVCVCNSWWALTCVSGQSALFQLF